MRAAKRALGQEHVERALVVARQLVAHHLQHDQLV